LTGEIDAARIIDPRPFRGAAVTRFWMLEAEVRRIIARHTQETMVAVMS
jgi:hypothetical protein